MPALVKLDENDNKYIPSLLEPEDEKYDCSLEDEFCSSSESVNSEKYKELLDRIKILNKEYIDNMNKN
jgi:hypothetical protein